MIYVTGDTHGEPERFKNKLKKHDTLIVLGDFGFLWQGGKEEQKRLHDLAKKKYQILFIDGTHENFDLLEALPIEEFAGGRARRVERKIFQLLRGETYTIEGKTLFTFGGGFSVDEFERRESGCFWQQEKPTEADYQNAKAHLEAAGGKVDYILTHEPSFQLAQILKVGDSEANDLTYFLDTVQKTVEFEKWCFGKWHVDRKIPLRYYAVFKEIIPLSGQGKVSRNLHKTIIK